MKRVYYIDCDCNNDYGMELVRSCNERVSLMTYSRSEALSHLKQARKLLKWKFKETLAELKKKAKKDNVDIVITIDCYSGKVSDEFDIEVDNFFDESSDNYHTIASRYLLGRY